MDILVVNINGLSYTKDLVNCLLRQNKPYLLMIIDQASDEEGTEEYLVSLTKDHEHIKVQFNKENVPLSRLWNSHYLSSESDLICFLNNDVLVPPNFVRDTITIFEKEPSVSCVIHATNHPRYRDMTPLQYEVLKISVTQGWDFAIRRSAYVMIPDEIKFYGGDDFLFNKFQENKWDVAIALSSPIVHFKAKSRMYYQGNRQEESKTVIRMGIKRFPYRCAFTIPYPAKENM